MHSRKKWKCPKLQEWQELRGNKEEEVVLRKGERRQTHKRYFSQSTKLPVKILPCHGPADSFTYMSTIFP